MAEDMDQPPQSNLARIIALRAELNSRGAEEVEQFIAAVEQLAAQAEDIVALKDAAPVGVTEMARAISIDLAAKAQTLLAIMARKNGGSR